jgi:hypothetical protein
MGFRQVGDTGIRGLCDVHSRRKRYWRVEDRKERLETISLTVPSKRELAYRARPHTERSKLYRRGVSRAVSAFTRTR